MRGTLICIAEASIASHGFMRVFLNLAGIRYCYQQELERTVITSKGETSCSCHTTSSSPFESLSQLDKMHPKTEPPPESKQCYARSGRCVASRLHGEKLDPMASLTSPARWQACQLSGLSAIILFSIVENFAAAAVPTPASSGA